MNQHVRKGGKSPAKQGLAAFASESAPDFVEVPTGLLGLKLLLGILLTPLCWVLVETFLVLLRADTLAGEYWKSYEFLAFWLGCLLWAVLFFGFRARWMLWLYVAGHELTHALFVLLCRGRVTQVHISAEGGHIYTNRNNFLISLSPYFFPFYTAVLILCWAVANWVLSESRTLDIIGLAGGIGFTWMFHITFTLWMIRRDQPDVLQNGRWFSFVVIFLANLLLICALLIVASPTATFERFFLSLWANLISLVPRFIETWSEIIEWFMQFLQ